MTAIKGLVIGMGVLILAGFIVVAVTLATRTRDVGASAPTFQEVVTLPPGGHVVETRMAEDSVVLRVVAADGGETLVFLDSSDGKERGRVTLAISP